MITTVCKISYGSQTVPPIVPAVQGDTGRAISFEIADFTPPAGATATYFILKPSGEAIYNSATITDNSILCELTAQSLAEAGENRMQVRVLQGEDIVTSFEVILMVRTFLGDDAMESGTEMNIFDQAVAQATEQFQENAEQIVEEVIESIPSDYTALTEEVDEINERLDEEIADVKQDLNDLLVYGEDIRINTATTGYYDLSTGVGNAIGDWTESTGYAQTIIGAKTGDKFKLYGFGSDKPRLWAFLGENDIILSVANAGTVVDSSNPIIITAPIGTLKAAFTIQVSYAYSIKKRIPTYTIADEQINSKLNYITETKSEEANKQSVMFDLHNVHGYISINGTITENRFYSIYTYLCGENDSVYFDAPPAERILQIAVYKDEQTAFTASGLKQYGSSSRDTLPLLASKMNLSTGDFVAIAVENTLPFNYHYHKTYINGDVVSSAGVLQKILVRKVNNGDIKLSVYVPNEQETNYCRYDFCHYYKKWDELGSATDVVSSDYWNNLFVYDKDDNYIAQGNSNFITLVYGERYHTGDGHGNEVALFCKFIADGEELDIDNMNVGDIVECSTLRMIQKSNIYKLGGGTANEYDATYPELDANNEPIVNFRHYINMEFAVGNTVKIDNRLEILRDGIKFAQCHGAMLQCYFGDFTDVICNNSESTQNKIASDGTATVASGSSINLRSNGYQPATMVEMFGGDFYIKQTMLNSSGDNSKTLIDFTFYQDRLKCYFMPVSCGADGDVLNTGDSIHVLCERKIDI